MKLLFEITVMSTLLSMTANWPQSTYCALEEDKVQNYNHEVLKKTTKHGGCATDKPRFR